MVLKTLSNIPLFQLEKWNDNKRFYPKAIKDKIISPKTKNEMAMGVLLGEIDHPENRFNSCSDFVSHAIKDMRFSEADNTIYGDIDILDTPRGRILKTLSDYGAIGFSARAMGNSTQVKEGEIIDPDSYVFKTFDSVVTPGFAVARDRNESFEDGKSVDRILYEMYENFSDDDKITAKGLLENLGVLKTPKYKENYKSLVYNSKLDNIKAGNLVPTLEGVSNSTENNSSIIENQNTISDEEDIPTLEGDIEDLKLELEINEDVISTLEEKLKVSKNTLSNSLEDLKESREKYKLLEESYNQLSASNKILTEALKGKDAKLVKLQESAEEKLEVYKNLVEALKIKTNDLEASLNEGSNTEGDSLEDNAEQIIYKNDFIDNIKILSVKKESKVKNESKKIDDLTDRLLKSNL